MNTRPILAEPMTVDPHIGFAPPAVPEDGRTAIAVMGNIITAQRVAVPRSRPRILQSIKALAASAGSKWVYRWMVKDRRANREVEVSGPTVKCCLAVAREYGNCKVDTRVTLDGDHMVIYAQFTDLETGYQLTRPYQQRMNQNIGMKDDQRARDMIFQIGVSKAIRNVIRDALGDLVEEAQEEADRNLLAWVGNNPDRARAFIVKVMTDRQISAARVERVIGRKHDKWTVADTARVLVEMRAIEESMADPDELYPATDDVQATVPQEAAQSSPAIKEPIPEERPEPPREAAPPAEAKPAAPAAKAAPAPKAAPVGRPRKDGLPAGSPEAKKAAEAEAQADAGFDPFAGTDG